MRLTGQSFGKEIEQQPHCRQHLPTRAVQRMNAQLRRSVIGQQLHQAPFAQQRLHRIARLQTDAGTRQRVRPVSSEPTDPTTPLSASEFLARVQRNPNLEAMVTPRAAVSLARAGYAVRHGQHESVDVIYATSMDVARNSEHVYQGSDGERIGGVAKLRLVLAESQLSAKQLTVVRLEHASLQGRLNARFQAAKTPVFIEEILTIPEGQHVLTFLKDGREVSSQFLYDAVLNELSEGA